MLVTYKIQTDPRTYPTFSVLFFLEFQELFFSFFFLSLSFRENRESEVIILGDSPIQWPIDVQRRDTDSVV